MLGIKRAIVAALGLTLATTAQTHAQDFFAGKRITLMINYAAGGPADIDGRVFARHIGRLIPGQPTVIVQNMDGAGGQVGANWLGEVAPKDGTVVGLLTGTAFVAAYGPKMRTDFRALEFVASQRSTSVYYMRADVPPGIKRPADLAKAQGVIIGGLAVDSSKDILLRLTLDILGVPHKYVTSYRGTNAVRLAIQQGEVNITSESPPAYRGVVEQGLVKTGIAIPVFYDPEWDGQKFSVPKDVEGLGIPGFQELDAEAKGRPPKGRLWDAYLSVIYLTGSNFRLLAFPPGTPKEAQDAMRVAVAKLASDPGYAEDAAKAFGTVPSFDASPDLAPRVRKALSASPEDREFFAKYIADANKGSASGQK
jgi:tripartite-type tricarboxylate transporter receptor subunit TctC